MFLRKFLSTVTVLNTFIFANGQINQDISIVVINNRLSRAIVNAKNMSKAIENQENFLPRSFEKGKLTTSDPAWWTSGFYPGVLWYLYEYSNDKELLMLADKYSNYIQNQQYITNNHDLGFMLYCSFGNGFRLTKNKNYERILLNGSKSLLTRYNPSVGLIRSWDFNKNEWQYPVIIDNMMNLELLYWAGEKSHNQKMIDAATSHALKTMQNHFRPDFSCYHVVSYDTISGLPHIKQTHQGINDSSSWARGQAWALYGYTMVYRYTKNKQFLNQAENVANYIMTHPSIPTDKVLLWDFNAPKDALRDASAAAIIASALIELSDYIPVKRNLYLDFAKEQLFSLSSESYFAKEGTNGNFILMHSVGNYPKGSEIDAPLTYADYYYVEALLRYKNILAKNK